MSLLDKLKSLFIIEETTGKEASDNADPPESPTKSARDSVGEGDVNPKFTEILLKALEQHNLDGYDYIEFINAVKALEKMNMDEATRFKSAFTFAQSIQVTPQHLIQSAEHYIQVLDAEKQKFLVALQNQRQAQLESRQAQLEATRQAIAEKQQQIEQLQKEIAALNDRAATLDKQLREAGEKIGRTRAGFFASLNYIAEKIRADIEKMKKYLD